MSMPGGSCSATAIAASLLQVEFCTTAKKVVRCTPSGCYPQPSPQHAGTRSTPTVSPAGGRTCDALMESLPLCQHILK